ncbi:thioredoxin-like protein [Hysterangium stoloniferum]|nr:thioredoxin-like protein [Hysterangium stoloniferum]
MSPNGITPNAPEVPTTLHPEGLTVHHLNNSRSQRLLWLLEELEIPYEIKKYERNEEMRAPQTLKDVHPLGKSPIITDGDITLAESGAITEYLLSKYGQKFRPTEAGKIDDLYCMFYLHFYLLIFSIIPQRGPALIRPFLKPVFANIEKRLLNPELKKNCDMLEAHLAKCQTGWLAGGDHPTAADFMMVFPAELIKLRGGEYIGPNVKEYVQRIHDRPAYKRALEKGGKYDYAKM